MTDTNITTLEQAGQHLIEKDIVDFNNMTVEGKQLLEVCGYATDKAKLTIDRQINKHNFKEGMDFTVRIDAHGRNRSSVYTFTMNAANHILLAAMTDKGKAARQEAIDMSTTIQNNGGEALLMAFIEEQRNANQAFMLQMRNDHKVAIVKKDEIIEKKSAPMSLTKILGPSNKVVQAANLWLEEEGYQTPNYKNQKRDGWLLSDKGRALGTQVTPASVFWISNLREVLPSVSELLTYAERLGLRDMKRTSKLRLALRSNHDRPLQINGVMF